jgi:hypothetical protein
MLQWLLVTVLGYGLAAGLTRWGYRSFLYPAPRRSLDLAPPGAEIRWLGASDGAPVQAVFQPPLDRLPERVIVFFHGNGETVADGLALGREIAARGVGFVAVEYRGYGGARAENPSEVGLYADAEGVLAALAERGLGPSRIALWGNSLGTGVAMEMARRGRADRLVLQAPYTSIPEVAARFAPFLPLRLLIDDAFDNASKAPAITVPTLVLHGDCDRVVPYAMGVDLAARIPGAELVTVAGGGHNDLFVREREGLLARIVAFATGP